MALDDMVGTHLVFGAFNLVVDLGQRVAQVLPRIVAFKNVSKRRPFKSSSMPNISWSRSSRRRAPRASDGARMKEMRSPFASRAFEPEFLRKLDGLMIGTRRARTQRAGQRTKARIADVRRGSPLPHISIHL